MRTNAAFTLIELMIVVVIVGILAAAAVPIYRSTVTRAYESEIMAGLGTVRRAARVYWAEHDTYPTDIGQLTNWEGPLLTAESFDDMKYVAFGDFSITGTADALEVTWAGSVQGYRYSTVKITGNGTITRIQ